MVYESLDDVVAAVAGHEGVLTISMADVRNAYGAERLGTLVREAISKQLRGKGIAHMPRELPSYQEERIRLYKMGTPVADLIDAVRQIGPDKDEKLREAAGGDAREVLDRVRALLCE